MVMTVGDVARHFHCQPWMVRRLCERKLVPEPERVGAYRVFTISDLPTIEKALELAGYLQSAEA